MARYDIMRGGIGKLGDDVSNLIKNLESISKGNLAEDIANEIVGVIKEESQTIDYNYQAYSAVNNDTRVERSDGSARVVNDNQAATYSEFGTGIVGKRKPNPDKRMGWQYDVNSHGIAGWRYFLGGVSSWTQGLPSNRVFYRSASRVRRRLVTIVRRRLRAKANE